jgi:hypothetical protein
MAFNYSPKVITDGLVLYLDAANQYSYVSGSTSWNDISRGGNNGTLVNGPTYNNANGGSIVFDGVNDFVNCGTNDILNLSNNYTLSCWIKTTTSIDKAIFQRYLNGGSFPGYALSINRTTQGAIDIFTGGTWYVSKGNNINNGSWNNIVVTINSTSCVFYQNLSSSSFTVATSTSNPSDTLFIGATEGIGNYFSGNIASTQIYNRALSATEVLQNYNATKTRFGL